LLIWVEKIRVCELTKSAKRVSYVDFKNVGYIELRVSLLLSFILHP